MKKIVLTSIILIATLSSCRKCYDCRIVQTAPFTQGIQNQTTITEIEFCGTSNELAAFKQDMKNNTFKVGSTQHFNNVVVDCN